MSAPAHAPAKGGHAAEKPALQQFHEDFSKLEAWINALDIERKKAYITGVTPLRLKDGTYDLSKLKDKKERDAVRQRIVNHYIKDAAKALYGMAMAEGMTKFAKDDFLNLVAGFTESELERTLEQSKDLYTLAAHERFTNDHIRDSTNRHNATIQGNLRKEKHKGAILDYLGKKGKANEMTIDEAVQELLETYQTKAGREKLEGMYSGKKGGHGH